MIPAMVGMVFLLGLIGAGSWLRKHKRSVFITLSGAAGVGGVIAMVVAGGDTPPKSQIPPPAFITRLDLQATRDMDTSTPCGLPAGGAGDNKPLVTDQTWTRTGGSSCYPISATAAQCFTAAEVPYRVDGTGPMWMTEPDAVNRVPYSTAINCTNWTCAGTASATPLQTAPDGSATATIATVELSANNINHIGLAGGTADALLTMRLWVKCSSGTLRISNPWDTTRGRWYVACSTVAGAWALLTSTHAAVTPSSAWRNTAAARAGIVIDGNGTPATFYIWAPTLTEEPGSGYAVIPTGAAAVSTGDPVWAISNGLRNTGAQLVVDGDMEAVGVAAWLSWNAGTVTKEPGSPGGSGSQVLRVAYNGSVNPGAQHAALLVGRRYRAQGWGRGDGTYTPRLYIGGGVTAWLGTASTDWQWFDVTFVTTLAAIYLHSNAAAAGWAEFDDITVYEQESYGKYYHAGDTVTQLIQGQVGTCWVVSGTDLLLSGAAGSECVGGWRSLQVTR